MFGMVVNSFHIPSISQVAVKFNDIFAAISTPAYAQSLRSAGRYDESETYKEAIKQRALRESTGFPEGFPMPSLRDLVLANTTHLQAF